ncbi:2838_t:CDS:2 [Acaulospora morrowiae]|uniref:2838_t:CDS:1 n=1 Tax=Acaulospora morrowiae TaxID=94023 RepID=A0A9N9GTA0_9GLOM|nr:2838_t:CDS:2 [Acaulospora morrowiae]
MKNFRFRETFDLPENLSFGISVDKQLSDNILSVLHSMSYSVERFAEPYPVNLPAHDDMSSKSRQKQPSFKGVSASDAEVKYKRKYKELKKKIRDMEEENEKLTLKLTKAKKNIQRLRIERSFLFDRLEQSQPTNESESEQSSSPQRAIDSEEELSSVGSDDNDDNGSQTTSMKQRQTRDPNASKSSKNTRRENQNKESTRKLGQECGILSMEEKERYIDTCKQEKQRNEKEKSACVSASLPESIYPDDNNGDDINYQHKCDEKSDGSNSSPLSQMVIKTAATKVASNHSDIYDEQYMDNKDVCSDIDIKETMTGDRIMDDLVSGSEEELIDELASDSGGGINNGLRQPHNNNEHKDEVKENYHNDDDEKEV